ncbi:MAG: siderophore-interacting protein [Nocardioides sp.]|uniref:siderophore-interacting protein n=1 Tax=Nocardioides sp. TaxID=35761 RepID=UPI0039E5C84D
MSLPYVVARATVTRAERLSPAFARIELAAPELADLGVDGPWFDQRVKLVFPSADGALPPVETPGDWFDDWHALPPAERGSMRTYSVRDLRGEEEETRLVVDLVLHLKPGHTGPASSWAATAAPGDQLIVVGPRRGNPFGGIEFEPGSADELLLVGDETAVPAISRILADVPADTQGAVFLEVPSQDDILALSAPAGVRTTWLARGESALGERLLPAVLDHLGTSGRDATVEEYDAAGGLVFWDTPSLPLDDESDAAPAAAAPGPRRDGLYAWIAGESGVVTSLRRHLVNEVGLDRSQVAFMGYWRRGVAMRS